MASSDEKEGDNELIGALTWFPETRANRDLYLVGYDRLNRTIEQALKQIHATHNAKTGITKAAFEIALKKLV